MFTFSHSVTFCMFPVLCKKMCVCDKYLLVIQNNVWSPNKIAGYSNDLKSIILIFIPTQISIMPDLTNPEVCGQHLIFFILAQRVKHKAKATLIYKHINHLKKCRLCIYELIN